MPRYAEFGTNTFVGSPSGLAQAYASSPTPQGYFAVLAWCVRRPLWRNPAPRAGPGAASGAGAMQASCGARLTQMAHALTPCEQV
jgi:hypothetical protein